MSRVLVVIVFLFSSLSYGISNPVSVDAQLHNYFDIVADPTNPKKDLSETLNFNFNLRFYRVFSTTISHYVATDSSLSATGLGLRIDLPGVFFVGAYTNEFVRRRKRPRVNTYFQVSKYIVSEENVDTYIADKIGFGADFFATKKFYINSELMSYSHQGNQFIALGAGIGYEF